MEKTIWLLAAAGVLMLLAGALFALIRQWVYAALIWAGALGCLAAALNFRGKAKDAHQHGKISMKQQTVIFHKLPEGGSQ